MALICLEILKIRQHRQNVNKPSRKAVRKYTTYSTVLHYGTLTIRRAWQCWWVVKANACVQAVVNKTNEYQVKLQKGLHDTVINTPTLLQEECVSQQLLHSSEIRE